MVSRNSRTAVWPRTLIASSAAYFLLAASLVVVGLAGEHGVQLPGTNAPFMVQAFFIATTLFPVFSVFCLFGAWGLQFAGHRQGAARLALVPWLYALGLGIALFLAGRPFVDAVLPASAGCDAGQMTACA